MKITKRQLKRIIREVKKAKIFKEAASRLEITQEDYNKFTDAIIRGFGYIDPDDVGRQWQGVIGQGLSPEALQYLIANLDANGLIREDEY